MRKYIIERHIPGVGHNGADWRAEAARCSNGVLAELGTDIQWLESFVTNDKIYCVYLARDEGLVREHAAKSGFPANSVSEVRAMLDPTTAGATAGAAAGV
jgi:hypothetical protein